MKRRDALKISLCAGAALHSLAQKGFSAEKKPIQVGFITKTESDIYFRNNILGAVNKAELLGIDLHVRTTDSLSNVGQQIKHVKELMKRQVDGMIIYPIDFIELAPVLKQAAERGIKIITIGTPLGEEIYNKAKFRVPHVGPHNAKGAELIAHDLIAAMEGGGKFAIIEGDPKQYNSEILVSSVRKILKQEPGIHIVASEPGYWDEKKAKEVFAKILEKHPDLGGVFSASDTMTKGILKAIDEAKITKQISIGSFEYQPFIQQEILLGRVVCTADPNPQLMADTAVATLVDSIRGKEIPDSVKTTGKIIDLHHLTLQQRKL